MNWYEVLLSIYRYVLAVVIIALSYVIAHFLAKRTMKLKIFVPPEIVTNTARVIRLIVLVIGVLVALSVIGVDLGGLLVAAGFTGIVIGLAAQQTLGNVIAGLALIFEGRVRVGSVLGVRNDWGVVEEVGIMATKIRLFTGEVLIVPNSSLFSMSIYNVSNVVARGIQLKIGISHRSDYNKAIEVIKKTLWEHPLVLAEPEPIVMIDSLSENSVDLNVMFWVPASGFLEAKTVILGELKKRLEEAGIEIPLSQRVVWLRKTED